MAGVLCLLLIISCRRQNTFKIFGEVSSLYAKERSRVYLSFDNDAPIDSTTIQRGHFFFQGKYKDSLSLRTAYIDFEAGGSEPIIIEAGDITLRVPKYTSGTPLNRAFTAFRESIDSVRGAHHGRLYALRKKNAIRASGEKFLDSLYTEMQQEIAKVGLEFIAQHPEDLAGGLALAELLRNTAGTLSVKDIEPIVLKLEPIIERNEVIRTQLERFKNRSKTGHGSRFIDFEGVNLYNQRTSLSDYTGKGKYILLDFWASWCVPCRKVFPELLELEAACNPNKFQIVGVFVWDSREHMKEEYNTSPEAFPLIIDENDISTFTYGIDYLPEFILFDPEGYIIRRGLLDEKMKQLILELASK